MRLASVRSLDAPAVIPQGHEAEFQVINRVMALSAPGRKTAELAPPCITSIHSGLGLSAKSSTPDLLARG